MEQKCSQKFSNQHWIYREFSGKIGKSENFIIQVTKAKFKEKNSSFLFTLRTNNLQITLSAQTKLNIFFHSFCSSSTCNFIYLANFFYSWFNPFSLSLPTHTLLFFLTFYLFSQSLFLTCLTSSFTNLTYFSFFFLFVCLFVSC